jgi:hypothetical protein
VHGATVYLCMFTVLKPAVVEEFVGMLRELM